MSATIDLMRVSSTSKHHPRSSQRRVIKLPFGTQRFLAAFEGIEGGFAIGASMVAGLSLAGMERPVLITTAVVSVMVSGFNAAAVKYSSEHYLDELDGREKTKAFRAYFIPAAIEFVSYFAISFISILPLLLLKDLPLAVNLSVAMTLIILFAAGWWRGFLLRLHPVRDGTETCILGACIILVGVISGLVIHG